ncbi:MAG: sugar phosphate isomerase/epimerase family protein [Sphingobacteriaceae bacterium]
MCKKLLILIMFFAGYHLQSMAQWSKRYPLFVFNNGVVDAQYNTPEKQVALVKEMGFSGMEKEGIDGLTETLWELDKQQLKLYTMYININLDHPDQPYDPRLESVFKQLKGRGTMPWLYVTSSKSKPSAPAEMDPVAIPILQKVADMAAKYKLKIMVYPHKGYWIQSVEDALRVVKKADRKNLGFTFNLCHFLAVEGLQADEKFIPLAEAAIPYLFAISLNGADVPTAAILASQNVWNAFIQPLGSGNYDTFKYLKTFISKGFKGPVGLQTYNIKADKTVHLKQSVQTWMAYMERIKKEKPPFSIFQKSGNE